MPGARPAAAADGVTSSEPATLHSKPTETASGSGARAARAAAGWKAEPALPAGAEAWPTDSTRTGVPELPDA